MDISDFGLEQERLARAFVVWWSTNREFRTYCTSPEQDVSEVWPMTIAPGELDEAFHDFSEDEITNLDGDMFDYAMGLMREEDKSYWISLREHQSSPSL